MNFTTFHNISAHKVKSALIDGHNASLTNKEAFHTIGKNQTVQDMLSELPRCNDMAADLHFPRFFGTAIQCEIARRFPRSFVKVGLNVQCKNFSILSGVQLQP